MPCGTTATVRCKIANSGLPRPLYVHDGKIEVIEATGLPLGLFDDAEYDEFTFKAKPGDMFVFFSDGILDARNRAGDMFGRHRTEADHRRLRRDFRRLRGEVSVQGSRPNMPAGKRHSTTRPWSPSR